MLMLCLCIFYLTKDATKRPYRLWRHALGTAAESDTLLHEEGDAKFWLSAYKSRSGRFLFAHAGSKETSEIQFIDLKAEGAGDAKLRPIEPRAYVAQYDQGRDSFTLWAAGQNPHLLQRMYAGVLGVPAYKLRVVCPDVGGGFGIKYFGYPEPALMLWVARATGRAVRWTATRCIV